MSNVRYWLKMSAAGFMFGFGAHLVVLAVWS